MEYPIGFIEYTVYNIKLGITKKEKKMGSIIICLFQNVLFHIIHDGMKILQVPRRR